MWINMKQSGILADRYLDIILGDLRNTLLMLIQAPVIAALIVIVWKNVEKATDTLYFVLVLSAVWLGCTNACREIVKERAIFMRERMVNLDVGAYVYSKVRVLAILNILQCIMLITIVNLYIHLLGSKLLIFLSLFFCSLAGVAIGLLISAITNSVDKAVGLVPLVVIPQILFSEFAIPQDYHKGITLYIEKLMAVKWGYECIREIVSATPSYWIIVQGNLILFVFTLLFLIFTGFILKSKSG